MAVTLKIKGLEEFQKKLKELEPEVRLKVIKKGIKPAAERCADYMRSATPISEDGGAVYRNGKKLYQHEAGNLEKSVSVFKGKQKQNPALSVGYQAGRKAKNDGFYGEFVIRGVAGKNWYPGKNIPEKTHKVAEVMINLYVPTAFEKALKKLK